MKNGKVFKTVVYKKTEGRKEDCKTTECTLNKTRLKKEL
jgi:hypothetical protein